MKNATEFRNKLERLATLSGDAEYYGSLGVQKHINDLIEELTYDYLYMDKAHDELLSGQRFFKAKPLKSIDPAFDDPDDIAWWEEFLDDDGFIHGWYSDGFIIGHVIEADDEYIIHEFWCPVDKTTLQLGKRIGE